MLIDRQCTSLNDYDDLIKSLSMIIRTRLSNLRSFNVGLYPLCQWPFLKQCYVTVSKPIHLKHARYSIAKHGIVKALSVYTSRGH